jgi:hypothetical protein
MGFAPGPLVAREGGAPPIVRHRAGVLVAREEDAHRGPGA